MNAHVIADHNMFSILFCQLCNWKCWKLDCYLDHGRGTHDIEFPGKKTVLDRYFTWDLLSYDPRLVKPHDETCEKSKSDRKRIVQNGTKRIARFEEKYAPKVKSIIKEATINERKMSKEDFADILTQMEKHCNGIN